MNIMLENSSIVILAKDFNPTIFKPFWLKKNDIFFEQELQGSIVITPVAVQIPTENFHFTVLPDRVQMVMPRNYSEAENDVDRVLGGIVKTLPHTPYTAVGLNFNYLIAPDSEDKFSEWNRKLFASSLSRKIQSPKDNNSRFGNYVSFDFLETRLKIDMKPIKALGNIESLCKSWHENQDLIRINVNFHSDVGNMDSPEKAIIENLNKWTQALAYSEKLTKMISE